MEDLGAIFRLDHDANRRAWRYAWDVAPIGDVALCRTLYERAEAQQDPFFALFRVAIFVSILRNALGLRLVADATREAA